MCRGHFYWPSRAWRCEGHTVVMAAMRLPVNLDSARHGHSCACCRCTLLNPPRCAEKVSLALRFCCLHDLTSPPSRAHVVLDTWCGVYSRWWARCGWPQVLQTATSTSSGHLAQFAHTTTLSLNATTLRTCTVASFLCVPGCKKSKSKCFAQRQWPWPSLRRLRRTQLRAVGTTSTRGKGLAMALTLISVVSSACPNSISPGARRRTHSTINA
jgi:hypothetical protein